MSDVDTQGQPQADTSDQQTQDAAPAENKSWYSDLSPDLANNPTLQKYNTAEDSHKAHLELSSRLGGDNVTWPKGTDDTAGWADVHKRLGVPESADGYKLENISVSDDSGVNFDRFSFQEQMKEINATPAQANKLWENYTGMLNQGVQTAQNDFNAKVEANKAQMQQELGATYETSIQRGQDAINFISDSQEDADELTVALAQTVSGMKAMTKFGNMMAESSIGGFQENKSFTKTPAEATMELEKIRGSDVYWGRAGTTAEQDALVAKATDLQRMINPQQRNRTSGF